MNPPQPKQPPKTTMDHLPIPTCMNPPCTKPMAQQPNPPSDTVFALWYSATIISSLVLIIIAISLLICYFKKSCKIPQQKSGQLFIALFIISLLFWLVEAALTASNIILASDPETARLDVWLGILPKIFYNIARAIMLFYFIVKSYVVFHDSIYSVSKKFIFILFILTFIAFVLQVFPLIVAAITGNKYKENVYYICSGWGIDFIVSIAAMYKFVSILFSLTLNNTDFNQTTIRLSSVQLKLMKTITRTTVLSVFAIVSSIVFGFFFNPYPAINKNVTGNDLNVAALSDSVLNAICMYLSYGFTTKQYEFCCKYCDLGIDNLCVWCTKKAIQRKSGKDVEDNVIMQNENVYSKTSGNYGTEHRDTYQLAVPSKSSKTHQIAASTSESIRNGTNDNEISANSATTSNMEMTIQNSQKIPLTETA